MSIFIFKNICFITPQDFFLLSGILCFPILFDTKDNFGAWNGKYYKACVLFHIEILGVHVVFQGTLDILVLVGYDF